MAKYVKDGAGRVVLVDETYMMQPHVSPVIVIPEADWRRLVELEARLFVVCPCCDDKSCESCREDAEAEAIIQRTEEENDV